MQTINFQLKNKDVQATAIKSAHAESMVNQWSIYDDYEALEVDPDQEDGGGLDINLLASKDIGETVIMPAMTAMSNELVFGSRSKAERSQSTVEGSIQAINGQGQASVHESAQAISEKPLEGQSNEPSKSLDTEAIFRSVGTFSRQLMPF